MLMKWTNQYESTVIDVSTRGSRTPEWLRAVLYSSVCPTAVKHLVLIRLRGLLWNTAASVASTPAQCIYRVTELALFTGGILVC